jgi:MFS family permease
MDAESKPSAETATPWLALAGVTATVSVFAIAQGLTYPLLSFILQRQGEQAAMIGLSAAMTPLGIVASAPLVPVLVRRFGAAAAALGGSLACLVLLTLIGLTQDVYAWFPLRFLVGAAINPLYVVSETWMIALVPPQRRGRIMGIYTAVISMGFAAGPAAIILVGTEGWPPFLVGIAAFAVCSIILFAVGPGMPKFDDGDHDASVRRFLPLAPFLLLAVVVTSAFEQSALSLLPVYGLSFGIGEATMSALLATLIAGNIALQVPLGLLAERWGARPVLNICAGGTVVGCLLLPWLIVSPLVWPLLFVLGAVSYGIYTMAIIALGERFSGSMLVAGNAAYGLMWGLGGMGGPPAAGIAMDAIGAHGLPLTLALLCAMLLVFGFFRSLRRSGGRAR